MPSNTIFMIFAVFNVCNNAGSPITVCLTAFFVINYLSMTFYDKY